MKFPHLAIGPLDGRYFIQSNDLRTYFSTFAYYRYRIKVEIVYLFALAHAKVFPALSQQEEKQARLIGQLFNEKELERVEQIENKVKHDVKAIEYYLAEKFKEKKLSRLINFVHFGLTSDDTNNLAWSLILKDSLRNVMLPCLDRLLEKLRAAMVEYEKTPMLGRTHGQPAVTTSYGKEVAVYYMRLVRQRDKLQHFRFAAKLNGAVGNYNGLAFLFPKINWLDFSQSLIGSLGLAANLVTTQILPFDNYIEYFQILSLTNQILVGLCQDIWTYIMLGELSLRVEKNQVGSSTMPQKVNPIDFENAESNLQLATSHCQFFERKLTISRLQRDLSDSMVKRIFGTMLGHTYLAWSNIQKGLQKLKVDEKTAKTHLNEHWEVLSEVLQLTLRLKADKQGYEKIRVALQGKKINQKEYRQLLKALRLNKNRTLSGLTPEKYIGLAQSITNLSEKK